MITQTPDTKEQGLYMIAGKRPFDPVRSWEDCSIPIKANKNYRLATLSQPKQVVVVLGKDIREAYEKLVDNGIAVRIQEVELN